MKTGIKSGIASATNSTMALPLSSHNFEIN
jgi:hypothetical protein